MAKYLVTGGCGFIGSHLVESLLSSGHSVKVLDQQVVLTGGRQHHDLEMINGSINNRKLVQSCMRDVDGCFHLASLKLSTRKGGQAFFDHRENLNGSLNVLEIAGGLQVPVVYASSSDVYGDNADWFLREHSRLNPLTAQGVDKLSTELHAKVVSLTYQIKIVGLRFFNVYGRELSNAVTFERDVVSSVVSRLMNGKPARIYGDGDQVRDFVYVDDAVNFLRAAMDCELTGHLVCNVCQGEAVSINQLARSIMSILNCKLPIVYESARKGDIRGFAGDPTLSAQRLGVSARYRIADGLYRYIQSQSANSVDAFQANHYSASASSQACFLR